MITIEGILEGIVYSNDINGYKVCEVRCGKDIVTVVGYMPFISAGETLKLSGKWVMHQDYGEQLKVELYEKVMPQTTDAIEKYLASGIIKGIGPATAAKIVKTFGEDTMNVIQFSPDKLAVIKGISFEKAMMIGQAFDQQRELREVIMFFQEYGIGQVYATKIYKAFGDRTIEEIKSNPYKLANESFGIGFKAADRIAMRLGIDRGSRYRVTSGIKYVLSTAAANGHTYLPEDRLKELTSQLLEVNPDNMNDALVTLAMEDAIKIEKCDGQAKVYLTAYYVAETTVSLKLSEMSREVHTDRATDIDAAINSIQAEEGIVLAEKQRMAVKEALINGVLVITGGPGTGKTTIIKTILNLLSREKYTIALAAPTGRAAKRMTEASGYEAKTIHRLLEIGYAGVDDAELSFLRNDINPIDADIVIIDEMSMVDILLAHHLLKAIAPGTRLIFVGDVDQLPSVGAGNVLADIIASGIVKTVKLTEIFRQAEESMIIVNAHRINRGENPHLNVKEKDFFYMPRSRPEDIVNTIVELSCKRLPARYGYDPMRHIQVLTPTRKGPTGIANLNCALQKALNPQKGNKQEKTYGDYTFREGDRVMQVKNNYNLKWVKRDREDVEGEGVFNGDTGIIDSIDNEEQIIKVLYEDDKLVEYEFSILDEIEPAYAITIHKSQGSEFPVLILPVYPGPQVLMTRNLLYTAVTRAKNLVILVGSEAVIDEMVKNSNEAKRYSDLAGKLKKCGLEL